MSSSANAVLGNNISSALIFVSLGTTVLTTFLIGYKIHSTSRLNGPSSKKFFNRVVVLVVESAAAYSLVLFLNAIIAVVPSFLTLGSPLYEAEYYVDAVLIVVAVCSFYYSSDDPFSLTYDQGMAPTILVARIALTNPNNTVTSVPITDISGLQFNSEQSNDSGRSTNAIEGDVNASIQTNDAEPALVIEVKNQSSTDVMFSENQV